LAVFKFCNLSPTWLLCSSNFIQEPRFSQVWLVYQNNFWLIWDYGLVLFFCCSVHRTEAPDLMRFCNQNLVSYVHFGINDFCSLILINTETLPFYVLSATFY
jgi:hypothetical protein